MLMAPPVRPTAAGSAPARGVLAAVLCGVMICCISLGVSRPAAAQTNKDDLAATVAKLNKKAMDEYDNLNFDEARKILKDALDFCREAGLDQHPVTARTNMNLGVVSLTGFKQRDVAAGHFRKALEIQPDIKLTRSLANPEIQAAFDEVVTAMTKAGKLGKPEANGGAAAGAGMSTSGGTTGKTPGASDTGIAHEPVTRSAQGQSVPIAVTIDPGLNADKVVLSYRAGGASVFVAQNMTEATPGNFIAQIPAAATAGAQVAYLIEAEKGGLPVASLGSRSSPLLVTLSGTSPLGLQRTGRKDPGASSKRGEGAGSIYVGVAVGTGLGWATGTGETSGTHKTDPSGFAPAQLVHVAPEFGYFLRSDLLLSVQARIQFLSGLTPCAGCAAPPTTAVAAFAKLTWLFGDDRLRPYFSVAAGGGRIRYVAKFPQFPTCGSDMVTTCVESIPSGAVMLGPGAGVFYAFTPGFGLVAGANSQLGFPTFTFNLDFNVGFTAQF
jgi:hypothetical protein